MRQAGIEGTLDEVFTCPDLVKEALCDAAMLQKSVSNLDIGAFVFDVERTFLSARLEVSLSPTCWLGHCRPFIFGASRRRSHTRLEVNGPPFLGCPISIQGGSFVSEPSAGALNATSIEGLCIFWGCASGSQPTKDSR